MIDVNRSVNGSHACSSEISSPNLSSNLSLPKLIEEETPTVIDFLTTILYELDGAATNSNRVVVVSGLWRRTGGSSGARSSSAADSRWRVVGLK